MNLEDKKRIAEWMGQKLFKNSDMEWKLPSGKVVCLEDWNPDSPDCPHSVWSEIWKRMTNQEVVAYYEKLKERLYPGEISSISHLAWQFHTTPPEICCKALLEMIK